MIDRPPAIPLVVHDPYFSVWSFHEELAAAWPTHWTGAGRGMSGIARIDGQPYVFMGLPLPGARMKQVGLCVEATRTLFTFVAGGIQLELTFCSPLLPDDTELLGRPVTYLDYAVRSLDGRSHAVQIYFDLTAEWALNQTGEKAAWSRFRLGELDVLRVGSFRQPILEQAGDNVRCDWGYVYLALDRRDADTALASGPAARLRFAAGDALPESDDLRMPRAASDQWPGLCATFDFGKVGAKPRSRFLMLGFDALFALEHMQRRLRPWWARRGEGFDSVLRRAADEHDAVVKRCATYDRRLRADLTAAGGACYADLCALAFRQCLGAHGFAAEGDGSPIFFSKENFSNGCINTVDVIYPTAPFFLLFAPQLLKSQLQAILDYARSPRWTFPFAPHDLGTYPLANGQVYGGGETSADNQMPVEECGNMLILVAAYVQATGDVAFAKTYRDTLRGWADYLVEKGLDPENQLCTDDFAGHLAHNANLALKAILGIGAYAWLAGAILAEPKAAHALRRKAERMARDWQRMAADGEHTRLVFDKPGTWSQKYNLIWDELLGLGLFPSALAQQEIAWYLKAQQPYGLPLDSRCAYTKIDWIVWSATLAKSEDDFRALIAPLHRWASATPNRVPMTDWFWTTDGRMAGFQARSVVGGLFIKLLKARGLGRGARRSAKRPRA